MSEKRVGVVDLQKALDELRLYWKSTKLTVCDEIETWIVETLSPENFNSFYGALDNFMVLFSAFKQNLQKEREKYVEIEKGTASKLWCEGARWVIEFIDKLLLEASK